MLPLVDDQELSAVEPVRVPVYIAGTHTHYMTLLGRPDPDYGYVFDASEALRWEAEHRRLRALHRLMAAPHRGGGLRPQRAAFSRPAPAGAADTEPLPAGVMFSAGTRGHAQLEGQLALAAG